MRTTRLQGRLEAASVALLGIVVLAATPVAAQKSGGTLRLYHNDNPPSTSLLEEATIADLQQRTTGVVHADLAVRVAAPALRAAINNGAGMTSIIGGADCSDSVGDDRYRHMAVGCGVVP